HYIDYYVIYAVALFFFFFQAEDGIRDGHVTGVQTCALPIWRTSSRTCRDRARFCKSAARNAGRKCRGPGPGRSPYATSCNGGTRSEERRVGKECRSRWSP